MNTNNQAELSKLLTDMILKGIGPESKMRAVITISTIIVNIIQSKFPVGANFAMLTGTAPSDPVYHVIVLREVRTALENLSTTCMNETEVANNIKKLRELRTKIEDLQSDAGHV